MTVPVYLLRRYRPEQVAHVQAQMQQIKGLTFKLKPVDGATLSQLSTGPEPPA